MQGGGPHFKTVVLKPLLCIIPLRVSKRRIVSANFKALRGTMTEIRQDNSMSRVATYFVFIFLIGVIVETLIATLGR